MSTSKHQHLAIIEENHRIAFCEIETEGESMKRRFHVVSIDHSAGQVYSLLPSDCPESGRHFGGISASGVGYVSKGRTRSAAKAHFRKHVREVEDSLY